MKRRCLSALKGQAEEELALAIAVVSGLWSVYITNFGPSIWCWNLEKYAEGYNPVVQGVHPLPGLQDHQAHFTRATGDPRPSPPLH